MIENSENSNIQQVLQSVGKTSVWISAIRAVLTAHFIDSFGKGNDQEGGQAVVSGGGAGASNINLSINKTKEFELYAIEIIKKKFGLSNFKDPRMEIKYPVDLVFDPYSFYFISKLNTKELILSTYDQYFNFTYDKQFDQLSLEMKSISKTELKRKEMDRIETNFHSVLSWADLMSSHVFYSIAKRTHLIDKVFLDSYQEGLQQFVVFGAGMDTRSYRLPLDAKCTIFEIDLPGVLKFKEKALQEAIKEIPPVGQCKIQFIPSDLSSLDWNHKLKDMGFDNSKPTLWVAEGLFMYLSESTIESIGELVSANSAPKSKYFVHSLMNRTSTTPYYQPTPHDFFKMKADTVKEEFKYILNLNCKQYLIRHGFSFNVKEIQEMGNNIISIYSMGSNQ
ncbi:hypothetical protein CYY_000436 [Polysphondylium violaceum]|uniref:S-adenosyl-L-methionine-dependent methyltransferase n=1 Tax=Polysphondylium violaceum TaxID=133409 RepID=A0A8J4Q1T0_9MYCE|nr:hypothetical protein CYY_000436 [Polysphondylium violaceum]